MENLQLLFVLGLVLCGIPCSLLASNRSQDENSLVLGGTPSRLLGSNYSQEENSHERELNAGRGCPFPFEDVLGRCLYFAELTSAWNAMRFYCQSLGGDLLKIDSADFMYGLIQVIENKELVTDHFWLGGNDKEREGLWMWTDGSLVKMGSPFWGVNCNEELTIREPHGGDTQNCMSFERRFFFYFHDLDCAESHSAICEYQVNE